MKYIAILLILVVGFTFSCASIVTKGRPVTKTQMDQLVVGETRVEKLTQIFGEPEKKEMVKPGEEKYTYSYYRLVPHWWTKDEVTEQKLEVTVVDGVATKFNLRGNELAPITKE
jgi:outer membrane protein assembly factor BamE (lipoprotein component of BamABCDE complex)